MNSQDKKGSFKISPIKQPSWQVDQGGSKKKLTNKIIKLNQLNFDPYMTSLKKSRMLSPASRARKVLGKTPKLDKKLKISLDSSIEKSLDKINKNIEEQYNSKNNQDPHVFSK